MLATRMTRIDGSKWARGAVHGVPSGLGVTLSAQFQAEGLEVVGVDIAPSDLQFWHTGGATAAFARHYHHAAAEAGGATRAQRTSPPTYEQQRHR
jgi:UDP-N-acetyl-D-mannosaminuronate dehydrogenase